VRDAPFSDGSSLTCQFCGGDNKAVSLRCRSIARRERLGGRTVAPPRTRPAQTAQSSTCPCVDTKETASSSSGRARRSTTARIVAASSASSGCGSNEMRGAASCVARKVEVRASAGFGRPTHSAANAQRLALTKTVPISSGCSKARRPDWKRKVAGGHGQRDGAAHPDLQQPRRGGGRRVASEGRTTSGRSLSSQRLTAAFCLGSDNAWAVSPASWMSSSRSVGPAASSAAEATG